jgi:hypothetical protein
MGSTATGSSSTVTPNRDRLSLGAKAPRPPTPAGTSSEPGVVPPRDPCTPWSPGPPVPSCSAARSAGTRGPGWGHDRRHGRQPVGVRKRGPVRHRHGRRQTCLGATADGVHWHRYRFGCPAGLGLGASRRPRDPTWRSCASPRRACTRRSRTCCARGMAAGPGTLTGQAPPEGDVSGLAVPPRRARVIAIAVVTPAPTTSTVRPAAGRPGPRFRSPVSPAGPDPAVLREPHGGLGGRWRSWRGQHEPGAADIGCRPYLIRGALLNRPLRELHRAP